MLSNPDHTKGGVVQALTEACEEAQEGLKRNLGREALFSGTTCIATAIHKNHVWTACVGDSRAVVGALVRGEKGADDKVLALDLSQDQCCQHQGERARIKAAGGQIAEFNGYGRVVAPDQGTVLAPTRSIGDCEFDIVGVIPTPEVTHFKLTGQEHLIIVASDGLWEFVSSANAVSIAIQCDDATQACDRLVNVSKRLWKQDGSGSYCDDITIIVIFLPLLSNQSGAHGVALKRVSAQELRESSSPTPDGCTRSDVLGTNTIELDMSSPAPSSDANSTYTPSQGADDKEVAARRTALASIQGGSDMGEDKSIIELNQRNINNFDGLNPNAKEQTQNRSWSPEWDRKMWPNGA